MKERTTRSLVKAFTWRMVATLDTFVLSYLVTGSGAIAGTIASFEVLTKMAIYFFHERAWSLIPWGRHHVAV